MKRLAALCLAAAASVSCAPKDPTYSFTYAEMRARLDNGLKMVIIPDKTTSLVQVDVRYEVGSNEDPKGKAGIAHLVEHMMFQHRMLGPDKPATFDLLPQIALGFNAYTTYDRTHYYLTGAKEDLEKLLKIEAYRLNARCETIPPEQFARELDVVRNEIRQRGGTPEGLIPQLLSSDIYPKGHPYSHTTGGDDAQLNNITFEDVCKFMDDYYTPDRATVLVTGNVDPQTAGRMIKGMFGGIEKRQAAPRVEVAPIDLTYKRVDHELDIERPLIAVSWELPPRNSPEFAKANALFNLVGKLAKQAEEWEFATNVGVTLFGGELAPSFVLTAELPEGGNIDEALEYIWKATKTAHWGFKNADFDRDTKAFLKMQFVESIEPLAARAELVATKVQFGGGKVTFDGAGEFLTEELKDIDAMTVDGYSDFVKRTLAKDKAVVSVFHPSKTGLKGDKRAAVSFSAKSHDTQPQPLVDPAEARRPLPAPQSSSILGTAERYTLDNGMRVVLLPTDGLPLVHAQVVFGVGAAHEPSDKAGISDVAARYLRPPLDANFTAFVNVQGYATNDSTIFVARGLNIYSEVVITGLERMLKIGDYDQTSLESFRKKIKDRYKSEDYRRELAYDQEIYAGLYGKQHPYVANGSATPASVDNIGSDAARSWKEDHFTAQNGTLIVVGNFDTASIKDYIDDSFGDWSSGGKDKPVDPAQAKRSGPEFIGLVGEERPQMEISIGYPIAAGIDGQNAARMVLSAMLNAKMANVRTELGSTYGIYAGKSSNVGPNSYQIRGSVDAPRAGESLKFMREQIEALRRGDDFNKEFALARRKVLKGLLSDSSQTAALASKLGGISVFGLTPDYYDTLAKYVAAASPAQVKALIATELDPSREVVTCMADRKTLDAAFREAGINEVRMVEPQ